MFNVTVEHNGGTLIKTALTDPKWRGYQKLYPWNSDISIALEADIYAMHSGIRPTNRDTRYHRYHIVNQVSR